MLRTATRGNQYPLVAEFTFNFDDTMVDTSGATKDFKVVGSTVVAAIKLPTNAVITGGAVTTEIAVTGATGFVGQHLVSALARHGWKLRLLVRRWSPLPSLAGVDAEIVLANLGDTSFAVTRGMRIAQLVLAPCVRAEWAEVTTLDETARGEGGFGSTGRH